MATQGIFLGGTQGVIPLPIRIITPDKGAFPGKSILPEWSLPLPLSPPMRSIWTILTPQVFLTSFGHLTKWSRPYKGSQSFPQIPRLHRDSSRSAALVLLQVIHNRLQHQQSSTPVLDAQAPSISNPGLGLGLGPHLFTGPVAGQKTYSHCSMRFMLQDFE